MKKNHLMYIIMGLTMGMLCGCSGNNVGNSQETAGGSAIEENIELQEELTYALPKVGEALIGEENYVTEEDNKSVLVKESVTVATVGSPNTQILLQAAVLMEEQGYELNIVECEDYYTPNEMVEQGQADCNYFQHAAYLERYNIEKGTALTEVAKIHYEPMVIYGGKAESLQEMEEGAKIAIPSNATGLAQALWMLQREGLLELMSDADLTAVKGDIASNPLSLELIEMDESDMPDKLEEYDAIICHMGYALQLGMDGQDRILAVESEDSMAAQSLAHGIVVKEKEAIKAETEETDAEEENGTDAAVTEETKSEAEKTGAESAETESRETADNSEIIEEAGEGKAEAIQVLIEVLRSDRIKEFIEEQYHGSIYLMSDE